MEYNYYDGTVTSSRDIYSKTARISDEDPGPRLDYIYLNVRVNEDLYKAILWID